ncbi:flagellar brake protein [Pseudodesulfovibrio tunisiensis]|uniref:flagellar brake protein n=1 Tax=Pseudodesulfovibrio tunisiensis TaxID=463192 RepID=UPI001FB39819|nr:flagellar brake protein [Pseudodesulfovibrio tunisiensis]
MVEVADSSPENGNGNKTRITKIPGIKLEVSPGRDVIVHVPGTDQNYRGTIVGNDPYEFAIAKVRIPSKVRKQLSFGSAVVLRYIHKGTVYGFRTAMLNFITSPTPLLFFSYPDVIEKIDLRQSSRVRCNIDATLHAVDGDVECIVINVSETGCKIATRDDRRGPLRDMEPDSKYIVSMNLGDMGKLKLPIAVKNIKSRKGILNLGTMFLDSKPEEMDQINRYLEKIQRLTA